MIKWLMVLFFPLSLFSEGMNFREIVDEIDVLMLSLCPMHILKMDLEAFADGHKEEIASWVELNVLKDLEAGWLLEIGSKSNRYLEKAQNQGIILHQFPGEEGNGDTHFICPPDAFPLPSGIMNSVCMFQVLEDIFDPLAALLEMNRLLKDGGLLFLVTSTCGRGKYFSGFSEEWLNRALEESGFEIMSVSYLEGMMKRLAFSHLNILKHWDVVKDSYSREYRENFKHIFKEVFPKLLLTLNESSSLESLEPTYICFVAKAQKSAL